MIFAARPLDRNGCSFEKWFLSLGVLLVAAMTAGAAAQSVSLAWDPSPDPGIAGYVVCMGNVTGQYAVTNNVGQATNATVSGLQSGGVYYFAVTAFTAAGLQSDPSNEIVYQVPGLAPTISGISNLTITVGTSTTAIGFMVGDLQTPAASLTLGNTSSNPILVPAANILFGGSGSNRTVTVTPVAGQTGTATITITVSDGQYAASTSFVLTVVPANTAPMISGIADQSTSSGVPIGPVGFTVSDADTSVTSLTMGGNSSNLALVPLANIVLGGSGSNRTVTVTPAAGQTGVATITITVSDGQLTASTSFVVTVGAANTAPTISGIANRSLNEDTITGAIGFTVGDGETAAGSLTLTRSSSSTTLIPLSRIVFGGSGANRTVTVSPATNRTGTATITVTVSDGLLTRSTSFTVTVNAVNDAPTISSIADQVTSQGVSTAPIGFTIGDVETAAGSLALSPGSSNPTLVPINNIVFGGSGANRSVTVTPVVGQGGTAKITVNVSDGQLITSTNFFVTVNAPPTAPPPQISSAAGAMNIQFSANSGKIYVVEYKNSLAETNWTTLTTLAGTNGVISVGDPTLPLSSRFYRVGMR